MKRLFFVFLTLALIVTSIPVVSATGQSDEVKLQTAVIANGKVSLRFLSALDASELNEWSEVGYAISVTNVANVTKTDEKTDKKVYTSVLAAGKTVTAQELGGDYLWGAVLSNIPAIGVFTISVTPVKMKDAERTTGAALQFRLIDGVVANKGTTLLGTYDPGDASTVTVLNGADQADYDSYVQNMNSAGYKTVQTYTMGNNQYTLATSDENRSDMYISYIPSENGLRIYHSTEQTAYPTQTQSHEKICEPVLWQLPADTRNAENGGMSYVIRAEDGSFIIIDGGYYKDSEVENLINFLYEKNSGQKPVISAWFLTHLHWDHYGCFASLAANPGRFKPVDIQGFYWNFPYVKSSGVSIDTHWVEEKANGALSTHDAAVSKWQGAAVYEKLHSGMSFEVAGVRFEILYTHEDAYPASFTDGNDTSTVIRMTANGESVLFLGDVRDGGSNRMLSMYREKENEVLQSGIVQVSHHGYEGATKELYEAINADTLLWPLNIYGTKETAPGRNDVFQYWTRDVGNQKVLEVNMYLLDSAQKIFISDESNYQEIPLPYSPTGDKMIDITARYNELINQYTTSN